MALRSLIAGRTMLQELVETSRFLDPHRALDIQGAVSRDLFILSCWHAHSHLANDRSA
jgi:hypothetical protein